MQESGMGQITTDSAFKGGGSLRRDMHGGLRAPTLPFVVIGLTAYHSMYHQSISQRCDWHDGTSRRWRCTVPPTFLTAWGCIAFAIPALQDTSHDLHRTQVGLAVQCSPVRQSPAHERVDTTPLSIDTRRVELLLANESASNEEK